MSPRVSIILPVRNGSATIARSVQSCLAQHYRDFELVIINDHSTDETGNIIDQYRNDTMVRIEMNPGRGLVDGLNHGIGISCSPYLARMDADDIMYPRRLEKQVSFLDGRPDVQVCGCLVRIPGIGSRDRDTRKGLQGFERYQDWINRLTDPDTISAERFVESPLVHPSVMMRRGALAAVGGYRETGWAEDYDLWLRMLEADYRLAKVPEVLMDWSDSPQRLTRTDPRYSHESFLRARAFYLARLPLVRVNGVMLSGAGFHAKQMSRMLRDEGITVHAFLDIHQGRIGKMIGGVPVLSAADLPPARETAPVQLSAVGQSGRREKVARLFEKAGYVRGWNYFCVA